ncbi:MAG TPA: zf-HC2 domain-containing protein [Streptosporangiaceae bacterium]|jgi:anti-sigma factor RsiW|nr:zf-HC2 domain-containing protein [Streptosporangiaceae bacterium]
MSHLGRRLSALVDGELGDAERDQAHAHLVSCEECRAEAAALRTLKRRVHGLGEAPADSALTRRLIALEDLSEAEPPRSRMPGAARARAAFSAFAGAGAGAQPGWDCFPATMTVSPLAASAGAPAVSPLAASAGAAVASPLAAGRGRLHTRYLVAGAVAALAVGLSAASFAAGGTEQHIPGPMITPEVDSFNIQHAATFGQLPTFPMPTASPVRQTVGLPKP